MNERREFRELVDPATVRETIAALEIDAGTEHVPLDEVQGRVLATRIDATIDVPGFDRATMDGYAVRASETFGTDAREPVVLELAGAVHAGASPDVSVRPGATVEISTGAVLPPGADAVVMVERTREVEGGIAIESAVAPGDNVMAAGADIGSGQRALGPGTLLTAREIALLAALGVDSVPVRSRPEVGIISTGDELVRPGESLDHSAGQIYDVNSHAIATAVATAGGEPTLYPHAGDDYEEMRRLLEEAADECQLVLSSGSTSASAVDVIYEVVEDRGEVLHHGIAVKPGKPMLIGRLGTQEAAYIGLPGYPVSALMVFRQFVSPRLREAAGLPASADASVTATMVEEERFGEGRMRLLPVGLVHNGTGALLAYPVDKGSGATTSLVDADGVVEVPPDTAYVEADEAVAVNLFSPDLDPPSVLGVGEDDPAFSRLLDFVSDPRYLVVGTREGKRRFERQIPDVAVIATREAATVEGTVLQQWSRTWGVLVPKGNPEQIEGIADLVDLEIRFANLEATSLRTAIDAQLETLASERDQSMASLAATIDGYGVGRPAHESAARLVARGSADAGLGLAATAANLDVDFVRFGQDRLAAVVATDRADKPGVQGLQHELDTRLPAITRGLAGYEVSD